MRRLSLVVAAVSVSCLSAVGLSACGGDAKAAAPVTTTPTTATTTTTTTPKKPATPGAEIAVAKGDLTIYTDTAGTVHETLPAKTPFGTPRTLLVRATAPGGHWLDVELPQRPNGSRAWVKRSDVVVAHVDYSVDVDLTTRTLVAKHGDTVLVTTPVVIGTPQNPTPVGLAYITDVIPTGNPYGAYGPYALALSAHSDTLTEFAGGDGQVAIHGTNAPSLVGQARSHGCVRVPNLAAIALAKALPVGTPVTIHT
jgi:lipoprotein-anchoring transpeptidase ErfK/SrfK